jgi:hypothetical protein
MSNSENVPLDDLVAQFKQLENSGNSVKMGEISNTINESSTYKTMFKNYGIYLILFVYTLILVIALQPSYLYIKDETTQKYKFRWKLFFIVFFISYFILIGIFIFFKYYLKY